jgi:aspartate/methionine/tyrosine aminotransferase
MMREFRPFVMERWQSTYENRVERNLSESGVHPMTVAELLGMAGDTVDSTLIGYGQSNGSDALRATIAGLYDGASPDHVCVGNGSAEINFVTLWTLLEPGSSIAIVSPTYMQAAGLARNMGVEVREIPLREDAGWQPDPADIDAAVRSDTRVIVVTNPGNPTGTVLSSEARDAVVRAASRAGAWILADEVYAGAEREGPPTPSFFGMYERVIATGSLSKAYGLPGLRIGWAVSTPALAERIWARKDYTTIGPGELTDRLATIALSPAVRPRILERTKARILAGWSITRDWFDQQGCFTYTTPAAGAICWARYDLPITSIELAERLRVEHSVLVVPGSHFERDEFVRIGFGIPEGELSEALSRVGQFIAGVRSRSGALGVASRDLIA